MSFYIKENTENVDQMEYRSTTGALYVPQSPVTPTPSGGSTKKTKSWVFTLNNYSDADMRRLDSFMAADVIEYMVYGKEIGDSGTPHLQGFVVWKNRKSFQSTRDLMPFGTHLKPKSVKSTVEEAAAYCRKDGDYKEFVNLT